ncbi:hypothetical protein [Alphaentomopoxvirus acuprea]|uniref:Uncharacterized protein n=1 Tax=Alphaentomopoxvirus acuprea TaxID=62099 RepID=W6JLI8_9POXV|nr:hypothetical protein BA82_gp126 [Anomala cuprea entomopoxvirus]BAO49486.1 hypothetical protein [Anomala cuprea entomopoxvirus]
MDFYFILIISLTYTIIILSIIGLIWGYLLSINKTRAAITQTIKNKHKFWYWFLNMLYWLVPISVAAGLYFFTVWYVMNPQAKTYWYPPVIQYE